MRFGGLVSGRRDAYAAVPGLVQLAATSTRCGGASWVRRLTLADVAGGSQALIEIDFLRLCRRRGLPLPSRQAVRRDLSGRPRYLDVEWQLPGGRAFALEIDGMGTWSRRAGYHDLLRTAELVAAGSAEPMRLPSTAVRIESDRVERILRAVLRLPS